MAEQVLNYCFLSKESEGKILFQVSQREKRKQGVRIMNYGKAIRTLRSAKGMSQKQLAGRAKLDPSYVSLLESGTRIPSAGTLEILSEALGMPLYLLMLFASENGDLKGISPEQAGVLGKQMLDILTQKEAKTKRR